MPEPRNPDFDKIPDMTLPERTPANQDRNPAPTPIAKPTPAWERPVTAPGGWKVGDRVLAPWEPIFFYVGTVREIQQRRVLIHFDDGDQGWVPAERVQPLALRVGDQVLSRRRMGPLFYPGSIVEMRGDEVLVAFDDGAQEEWTRIAALRIPRLPEPDEEDDPEGAVPTRVASNQAYLDQLAIDQRVWAPWSQGVLFVGTINDLRDGQAHIHFDDGDRGWVRVEHLLPFEPRVGMGVIVNRKRAGQFHPGVIAGIEGGRFHIRYDDGAEEWTHAAALALVGQVATASAQPTHVAARPTASYGWLILVAVAVLFFFARLACR